MAVVLEPSSSVRPMVTVTGVAGVTAAGLGMFSERYGLAMKSIVCGPAPQPTPAFLLVATVPMELVESPAR